MLDSCPKCKVSLIGGRIPEEIARHYSSPYYRREIGIEIPSLYDGVSYWQCPDCQYVWKALPWVPDYKEAK